MSMPKVSLPESCTRSPTRTPGTGKRHRDCRGEIAVRQAESAYIAGEVRDCFPSVIELNLVAVKQHHARNA